MFNEALEYVINLITSKRIGVNTAIAATVSMFNVDADDLAEAVRCQMIYFD